METDAYDVAVLRHEHIVEHMQRLRAARTLNRKEGVELWRLQWLKVRELWVRVQQVHFIHHVPEFQEVIIHRENLALDGLNDLTLRTASDQHSGRDWHRSRIPEETDTTSLTNLQSSPGKCSN
jgi:hypothetical protein